MAARGLTSPPPHRRAPRSTADSGDRLVLRFAGSAGPAARRVENRQLLPEASPVARDLPRGRPRHARPQRRGAAAVDLAGRRVASALVTVVACLVFVLPIARAGRRWRSRRNAFPVAAGAADAGRCAAGAGRSAGPRRRARRGDRVRNARVEPPGGLTDLIGPFGGCREIRLAQQRRRNGRCENYPAGAGAWSRSWRPPCGARSATRVPARRAEDLRNADRPYSQLDPDFAKTCGRRRCPPCGPVPPFQTDDAEALQNAAIDRLRSTAPTWRPIRRCWRKR